MDLQDRLHIVLRDARSARYKVTDLVYDSGSGEFTGTVLLDGDGINYMGPPENKKTPQERGTTTCQINCILPPQPLLT